MTVSPGESSASSGCSMKKLKGFLILSGLALLTGCGGKNALISSGQSGVFVQSIALSPLNPSITLTVPPAQPTTQPFVATATPNIGNPFDITKQVSWSAADNTVATVGENGVATAMGSGRTYISLAYTDPASGKSFNLSTILTVVPQLTSISVGPASAQIAAGTSQQYVATGNYNDKSTADISSQVSWSSSQPVATISGSPGTQGLATGVDPGNTNVTAALGTVTSNQASLTVSGAHLLSLALSPSNPTIPLAAREQITATGTFDDGTTQDLSRNVSWSTLQNPSKVSHISATGVATGLGLGTETITAQSPAGPSASTVVNVDESSVSAINVLSVPMVMQRGDQTPQPVLANGTKQQMRAIATFKDGSSLDVTAIEGVSWSSTNPSVATVDAATGLMSTVGPGLASITAALGSKQGSTSLTVLNAPLQSLSVGPNNASVPQGGVQNVVAIATFLAPDQFTLFQQDVSNAASWSVDANATLGYVNGLQELATGSSSGTANITASFATPGGTPAQASTPLNVTSGQLASISIVPGSAAVPMDGSRQFLATGNFSDGTLEDLSLIASWSSSDDAITIVSPFGFTAANGPGQTDVSAGLVDPISGSTITGSGQVVVNPAALARIDICAATVSNPIQNCPPLDPPQQQPPPSLGNQTQFGLVAIGTFTDGSRQDLTDAVHWSSQDPGFTTASDDPGIPGIATGVGHRGVLSGNAAGTATINASSPPISGSTIVEVSSATLQNLTIKPANGIVTLGQPQQLKVVGTFSDGSSQDVTSSVQWLSLNPDIAIVNPGGLAYTTGRGIANVLESPGSLVVSGGYVSVTMVNPSPTAVFSWGVGTVFQFQGLTVSSGDVSMLNNTPFTILNVFNPSDPNHIQRCQPGQNCTIQFSPSFLPADGTYAVTGGSGQASALITATMNVVIDSVLTPVSGSTTLTVQ
jgi:hypothetical protein